MAPSRPTVAVVGSLNLDLVVTADRLPGPGETVSGTSYDEHPGGKGLNQAVAAARAAGDDGPGVLMFGAVGDDAAGDTLIDVALGAGVDVGHLRRITSSPTGRAAIAVDRRGENTIVVVPGANAHLDPADIGSLGAPTVVIAQLEVPLPTVRAAFSAARRVGAITVLDPAPARPLDDELLSLVDVVCPNEHELADLGGTDRLFALGVGSVVVTLGGAGVRCSTPDSPTVEHRAFSVDPIDTTGAGDAFRGALASRLAAGDTVVEALPFATAAGALATTVSGAVPSLPVRAQIESLLGRR